MQYIQLRKTTYHFRYKIPLRFRAYHPCGEIRRSLKTDCYSVVFSNDSDSDVVYNVASALSIE
ncbi:DUF6538 domain-containing protein [Shewanella sp.]|uniref:DUF6538 domain-containing protein n=1 Tax=Shewanella TaxID=22 RepID=UPI00338D8BE7